MAHKVGVIALECVEDERLVRLGDLVFRESPLVRQIHLGWQCARVQTRHLGVQLQVHGFGGLNAQDELVATDVFENTRGDVLELNSHFHFGVIQRSESGARGIWRDSVVIEIAWFPVGTHVLAEKYIFLLDRRNGTKDLHLNVDVG